MADFLQDPSGNWYVLSVNSLGNLVLTPTAAPVANPTVAPPTSNSTVSIQQVTNFASQHTELMPLVGVGGYTDEPALSIANDTLQEILSEPYAWEFNRADAPLMTTQSGVQQQQFAGATAWTSSGGVGIDLAVNNAITQSGTTVTVYTLDPHPFSVGQTVYMAGNGDNNYNSTFTQSTSGSAWSSPLWGPITAVTSKSFSFTHTLSGLANSGAPGIVDFGWGESATMVDMSSTEAVPYVWECQMVSSLKRSSQSGRPRRIAMISDNGNGVLTFRFEYVPGSTVWGITCTYQKKPPLKASLADDWSPFPDAYGFVYRQAFLARCYRYLNHARADAEEARALAMIQKATRAADREDSNQYVTPETPVMGGYYDV